MALELNQLVQPDYTTKYLWVTDKTGTYLEDVDGVVINNGWGTPNFNLFESALGVVAVARDELRTVFGNISPRWKFNNSSPNETENIFQISYDKDSVIDVYLIRLMVTYDDVVSVDSITFQESNYFYNTIEGVVKKIENGEIVIVEDMLELVDKLSDLEALDGNTMSVACSDAYVVKLASAYNKDYKEYAIKRKEGCDNLKEIFYDMLSFKEDIIGARRLYTSGLTVKSQDVIETLTEEKNIQ